ncbi:class I SAM-dependent methyltransferase [Nonomuraea terrae]|uniref:Class I SAM-dependent methyltransferase n=1 Tax=Nonomuraea terrae TaxID=2530383 RepID=A0A4R4Z7K8_9ACTN|nr:class I SAM-dependent methyltransferase [Nonomuraea terrae]TDD54188.1 class I SAM-dependent methyltransferase [Nonomuraea terrae]
MYGTDYAEISDLMYRGRGRDYRAEAEEVARRARSLLPDARSLLDVGCGTGAHLEEFADLFEDVAGLELSQDMLAVARVKDLPCVWYHGDMRAFDLGRRFDVVTCMTGAIGHVESAAELTRTLQCFARHLSPGGVVAVDPWWFPETFSDGYVAGDVVTVGERTVARVSHGRREGDCSRTEVHHVIATPGDGVRHFSEVHLGRLFSRAEYEAAFAGAGLAVEYIEGLHSGRGLFVACRG